MKNPSTKLIMTIFLFGIFMGALDSGIVSPAREIIQNTFGVSASYGTWMITIYTLIYAVSMPIVSKLSDRYGYRNVYIIGIGLFGVGSFLAGIANFYGSFEFFLVARVIQAIGSGGIIPIANAVIGHTFPVEKRGFALGMVGGIYGIATILGPTAGSAIIHVVGTGEWGWLFFINIPISVIIIILSIFLKNEKSRSNEKLDFLGSIVLTGVIGSLMYAFTKIDLFNIGSSIQSNQVWPFLLIFLSLIPILIFVENRAKDPVLNLKYFKNTQILLTLAIGFIVGIGMMGMVFVPQFGENVLRLKAGTGGYLVTILAIFSGIAAPISGRLLDKFGAKISLILGFVLTVIGTLWMAFVVTKVLGLASLFIGLAIMGLGVGFTMGAPLNYLMLSLVPKEESTAALATLSVIRSIGVTLSPSLMIGFVVSASKNLQGRLMDVLSVNSHGMLQSGSTNAFKNLIHSDVTTITDMLKEALGSSLSDKIKPMVVAGIEQSRGVIESTFQMTINEGYKWMFISAAIIAFVGITIALAIKENKASK